MAALEWEGIHGVVECIVERPIVVLTWQLDQIGYVLPRCHSGGSANAACIAIAFNWWRDSSEGRVQGFFVLVWMASSALRYSVTSAASSSLASSPSWTKNWNASPYFFMPSSNDRKLLMWGHTTCDLIKQRVIHSRFSLRSLATKTQGLLSHLLSARLNGSMGRSHCQWRCRGMGVVSPWTRNGHVSWSREKLIVLQNLSSLLDEYWMIFEFFWLPFQWELLGDVEEEEELHAYQLFTAHDRHVFVSLFLSFTYVWLRRVIWWTSTWWFFNIFAFHFSGCYLGRHWNVVKHLHWIRLFKYLYPIVA